MQSNGVLEGFIVVKKLLLFIGLCILLSGFATAAWSSIIWESYEMEDLTGYYGRHTPLTNVGAAAGATGKKELAYAFNSLDPDSMYRNEIFLSVVSNFTVCAWTNLTSTPVNNQSIFGQTANVGAPLYHGWTIEFDSSRHLTTSNEGGVEWTGATHYNLSSWLWVCTVHNSTNGWYIYANATLLTSGTYAYTLDGTEVFDISRRLWDADDRNFNGIIDEITVFNTTLTAGNITTLFNSGNYLRPRELDIPLNVTTLIYPTNTTHYSNDDYTGYINFTTTYNATCYINSSSWANTTPLNNTVHTFYWATPTDFNYSIYVNCTENAPNTSFWFVYDSTHPIINQVMPSIYNTTFINASNKTLTFNINTTDMYLYQANLTLTNSSGYIWYSNWSGILAAGTNTYNWTGTLNNLSAGRYYLLVESTDSHTAKLISDFVPKQNLQDKKIDYQSTKEWGNIDFEIKLINSDIPLSEIKDTKKPDRHSPQFIFADDKIGQRHTFVYRIHSSYLLDYIENSEYIGHFVSTNGMQGIWYDSMFDGYEGSDFDINKVDDYTYDIEISTFKNNIKFNSLGGLNYNFVNSTFEVHLNMTVFAKDFISGATLTNFSVTFNTTTNYSGSANNITFSVPANTTFNINASKVNYNMTTLSVTSNYSNFNVTIYLSSPALNITIYDETTYNMITDNVTIILHCESGNYSTNLTTSSGYVFISGLASGFYEITYSSGKYFTRTYYATLTEPTLMNVKLFMIDTGNGTRTIWAIRDYDYNVLENVIIKMQRFYTQSNSYETVSMALTSFNGQAVIYVDLYDVPYKVEYDNIDGDIYKINDASLIVSDFIDDKINIAQPIFYSFDRKDEIYINLSFDNTTYPNIFANLIWSSPDNLVREVCLQVVEQSINDRNIICLNCSSSTAGSLGCLFVDNGNNYIATGLVDTNTTGTWYPMVISMFKTYTFATSPVGRQSMFYAAIIIGELAFIGIGSMLSSIVLVLMGVIFLSITGFLIGVTYNVLIWLIVIGLTVIILARMGKQ